MFLAPFALAVTLTCQPPRTAPALSQPANGRDAVAPAGAGYDDLYAARLRRRLTRYLRLRLLELQRERLDRVLEAVRAGIPIDLILAREDPVHFCPKSAR